MTQRRNKGREGKPKKAFNVKYQRELLYIGAETETRNWFRLARMTSRKAALHDWPSFLRENRDYSDVISKGLARH